MVFAEDVLILYELSNHLLPVLVVQVVLNHLRVLQMILQDLLVTDLALRDASLARLGQAKMLLVRAHKLLLTSVLGERVDGHIVLNIRALDNTVRIEGALSFQ